MDYEIEDKELIDRYLRGLLDGDELMLFREKMTKNIDFRREIVLQRRINKGIENLGRQNWKEKLDSIHQEIDTEYKEESRVPTEKVKHLYNKRTLYSIAAVITLLIIASFFIFEIKNSRDSTEIFISYYQPYEVFEQTTRSTSGHEVSEKTRGYQLYANSQFAESIVVFNRILKSGADEAVLFYLGNAYLSNNQPKEAEKIFKEYIDKYTEFKTEAQWYLALCYLKLNREQDAKRILQEIVNGGNYYKDKAGEILKLLGDSGSF
jgi:tetratricopeptide (TPR) repeat protein